MKTACLHRAAAILLLTLVTAGASAQDRYAALDGVKIRYIDRGKGEPVVLLHGGTSDLESWVRSGVVANLEKDFRVIAYDARGHGKSDKPRDASAYGRQQALDVVRLLDALKIQRAHIVGFSLGGSTVAQLLTLHPERFLTATQVSGSGRSPEAANDPRIEVEAAEIEKECISRSRLLRQAGAGAKPTEDAIRKRQEQCRADSTFDQYSTAASLRGYRDQAVTAEQMKAVKVPTLGLAGTLDSALKDMQNLSKLRPDMKFVVLEGATHAGPAGMQNQPGLVVAIREFIAAQR